MAVAVAGAACCTSSKPWVEVAVRNGVMTAKVVGAGRTALLVA